MTTHNQPTSETSARYKAFMRSLAPTAKGPRKAPPVKKNAPATKEQLHRLERLERLVEAREAAVGIVSPAAQAEGRAAQRQDLAQLMGLNSAAPGIVNTPHRLQLGGAAPRKPNQAAPAPVQERFNANNPAHSLAAQMRSVQVESRGVEASDHRLELGVPVIRKGA